jgi:hypothetical protein
MTRGEGVRRGWIRRHLKRAIGEARERERKRARGWECEKTT